MKHTSRESSKKIGYGRYLESIIQDSRAEAVKVSPNGNTPIAWVNTSRRCAEIREESFNSNPADVVIQAGGSGDPLCLIFPFAGELEG